MEEYTISIITVGMNHLKYIKNLYRTLLVEQRPNISFEAIYVDNCSTDGSQQWLKDTYPEVKIIQNSVPLGFGENNNIGVKASSGKYVAIINPDIEVLDHAIDRIVEWMEEHKDEYGIVAPQLLNPNMTVQYSVRSFITLKLILSRFITRGNDESSSALISRYLCKGIDMDAVQPINWAMGAALFLTHDFYCQLGGFDTDYFLYMEDEDICLRSWKLGKPVIYVPHTKLIHNHLRASLKIGKKQIKHFKSLYTFFRKHGVNVKSPVVNGQRVLVNWK